MKGKNLLILSLCTIPLFGFTLNKPCQNISTNLCHNQNLSLTCTKKTAQGAQGTNCINQQNQNVNCPNYQDNPQCQSNQHQGYRYQHHR